MAGSGLIEHNPIHALNDQQAKLFIKSWLQLCHIDKMLKLCHVNQDAQDETLHRRYSPSQ